MITIQKGETKMKINFKIQLPKSVSRVIDNRAKQQSKGITIDRKRLRELREKQEGLGMRMG